MKLLTVRLKEKSSESAKLENILRDNLRKVGYGF